MKGTISVCIPAYRGRFLEASIESVLAQTRPVDEIIVVDDYSPDDLEKIVSKVIKFGVKYVRNPKNVGVPENYNLALSMAQSDYVMIFGDHDVMLETYIERCAGLLDADPEVVFVFSAVDAIDESGNIMQRYKRDLFPTIFLGERMAQWIVTRTASAVNLDTLIRRSALDGLEPWFDPKYWWYADIHLWLRLASKGKVGYVAESVLQRRRREKEHYLNNKEWQSALVCDRIRRDAWSLAYPYNGLASLWGKLIYATRRDRDGLILVLSKLADGGENADVLPEEALSFFSPVGRLIAPLMANLPHNFACGLRRVHRRIRSLL
jgi:glycosyltransferase involved in cell wall biosynthesis